MSVVWIEGKAEVPPISDELLSERLKRFTVLVQKDGELFRRTPCDPRNIAFTWEKPTEGGPVQFKEVTRTRTKHTCGYHAFFKPSLAEVLAQMPDDVGDANAFFIITDTFATGDKDETDADDIQLFKDGSGHLATTVYGRI